MKQLSTILILFVFTTAVAAISEPEPQSSETKVLARYSGTWQSDIVIKPSGRQQTAFKNAEWVLNEKYLQATIKSGGSETFEMHRYDPKEKVYQKWIFTSSGGNNLWLGSWDEQTETMTWKFGSDSRNGTKVDRFISEDKYEGEMIIKDASGKILVNVELVLTRVKPQSKK